MTRIAVLGADGCIARIAEDMPLAHDDIELTLFIHTENELGADIKNNPRVTLVKGDAKNPDDVLAAIKGAEVSRKSVASEVVELLLNPSEEVRASIGLDKPGTEGDKPEWMLSNSTEHLSE